MNSTIPSIDALVEFARDVWAETPDAEREIWRTKVAENGAEPADPNAHPHVREALKIFASEIGAI